MSGLKKRNPNTIRTSTFREIGIAGFTSLFIVMLIVKETQFSSIKAIAFVLLPITYRFSLVDS
jgi:hypothetical protein